MAITLCTQQHELRRRLKYNVILSSRASSSQEQSPAFTNGAHSAFPHFPRSFCSILGHDQDRKRQKEMINQGCLDTSSSCAIIDWIKRQNADADKSAFAYACYQIPEECSLELK